MNKGGLTEISFRLRVASLSDELDREGVDEDVTSIMMELYRKRSPLLVSAEDHYDPEALF